MDISAEVLGALDTSIRTQFNVSVAGADTTYQRVAMTVPSNTRSNSYPKLREIGGMREWVGERQVDRLESDAFTIVNKLYENTIVVPRTDIEDDQYGLHARTAGDFGQAAAELPDELVWELLPTGFTATHYDGQFFFDTDHPVEDEHGVEQSVSNFGGGAGTAWYLIDTSRSIKPVIFQDRTAAEITPKMSLTDDNVFFRDEYLWGARRRCNVGFGAWQLIYASRQTLNAANYAAARTAMLSMRGHKGRKINLRPNLLVVPPSLEGAAREILMAERDAAGATNVWRNTADLHVENRLT